MDSTVLLALLHLSSPSLPVGAFSYSQGLEQAIEEGLAPDESGVSNWISGVLRHVVAPNEGAFLAAMLTAFENQDEPAVARLDRRFLAGRETAELRAETLQMGHAMRAWLRGQNVSGQDPFPDWERVCWPTAWAKAAYLAGIPVADAVQASLYSWAENQVLAAVKAVPLGQAAGTRILVGLRPALVEACAVSLDVASTESFGSWAPGYALASARHEILYSRLFRS